MSDETKRRENRNSTIIGIAIVGSLFGSIIVHHGWWAPRYANAEVDSIREVDTPRGPLLLASESVGRSNSTVICRRSTLVDPATLQRVARDTSADAEHYLGQDKSNVTWFSQMGRGSDHQRFTGRDPATLAQLVDSTALVAKYPGQLGTGVNSFKFNWEKNALEVLANDNRSYLIAGPDFVPRPDANASADVAPDTGASAPTPRQFPQKYPGSNPIAPTWIDVRDAKSGSRVQLESPPGWLLSTRATLLPEANVTLTRLSESLGTLWSHEFSQREVVKVYRYENRLLVVSSGGSGTSNDWITALDAATGSVVGQYQF